MKATRVLPNRVTAEHHRRPVEKHKTEKPKQAPLVYSRGQTAQLLNVSEMTVRRLEERGILKPVRLMPVLGANVFHRAADIHALIGLNGKEGP